MKTKLCNATQETIEEAARLLLEGELVAFPTETVYGLGANGMSEDAVAKIFSAKGRPQDNPLILHIADAEDLGALVQSVPDCADALIKTFWPGPLTLVFDASDVIPANVTAGGTTVAIRMPSHPVALDVIRNVGQPIAAPSANRSGRPSPTDAQTVLTDMDGRIPMILDGGSTQIGLESTVLDITRPVPVILRPGFITHDDIQKVIGLVQTSTHLSTGDHIPRSPGQKYRHYAPRAKVRIYRGESAVDTMREHQKILRDAKKTAVLLLFDQDIRKEDRDVLSLGCKENLAEMAHLLYKRLRDADARMADEILVPAVPAQGWGFAIMNRLEKAALEETL